LSFTITEPELIITIRLSIKLNQNILSIN